ncbi:MULTISPECIES: DUF494 family protein [Snodgrassella]|uniref:Protein Smg homolog n=2 Tax=Snodgrassella alvi TaxID=1196083 RepID=A0A1X0TAR9_9NEIS|nr:MULTISPECIES: DUF494 domain-containing protein [Snodgrassella]KEQ01238.1 hypothetical protein SASC598J21_009760 [Snodgrassella alvi SCGC AB-598-J21]AHN27621.1 smg protein, putative [Snodgrassella alvi wkB2]MBI0068469.1 DUF494 domain-containing protein [Snodgrassella sp. M0110]MBI0077529.1 DUF494 domain-containing protein [Snodgrassella sp. M0118]MBI0079968.1 DUF494 domain-containing protein [Snodgrassella sp. M0112]
MIDVIAFLIEHFQDVDAFPPRKDLGVLLEEVGFNDEEIGDALSCLDDLRFEPLIPAEKLRNSTGSRIYNNEELDALPLEVRGLVHFLEQNGALNPEQREFVLNALMNLPYEDITVDHAKVLALLVLWAHRSELPVLIGDELMAALNGEAVMQ